MKSSNEISARRIALVTGAARGLGAATAKKLAAAGCLVLLGVRDRHSACDLLASIVEAGGQAEVVELDVTRESDIQACLRLIAASHGKLDILVNNAAVMLDGKWVGNSTLEVGDATLRKTFDTNFFAAVAIARTLWPLLERAGHANVVNVSSLMGSNAVHADPEGALAGAKPFAYDASKAALNTLTTHLAELGRASGIQVNSAHPGWVRTSLGTEDAPMSVDEGVQTIIDLALLPAGTRSGQFEHLGSSVPW